MPKKSLVKRTSEKSNPSMIRSGQGAICCELMRGASAIFVQTKEI